MKKNILKIYSPVFLVFVTIFITLTALSASASWSQIIPLGKYEYKGRLTLVEQITVISLNHNEAEDLVKIRKLRAQGYLCLRKNQTVTLCQIKNSVASIPENLQEIANERLKNLKLFFSDYASEPMLLIDTSSQKEWAQYQKVSLASTLINYYKIIYVYEKQTYYCSFPMSEDQPLGVLQIANQRDLLLSINLFTKEDNKTISYISQAHMESTSETTREIK